MWLSNASHGYAILRGKFKESQTLFLIPNVVRNDATLSDKRALKIQLSTVITLRCLNLALVSFQTKVLCFLFLLTFHLLTLSQCVSFSHYLLRYRQRNATFCYLVETSRSHRRISLRSPLNLLNVLNTSTRLRFITISRRHLFRYNR